MKTLAEQRQVERELGLGLGTAVPGAKPDRVKGSWEGAGSVICSFWAKVVV